MSKNRSTHISFKWDSNTTPNSHSGRYISLHTSKRNSTSVHWLKPKKWSFLVASCCGGRPRQPTWNGIAAHLSVLGIRTFISISRARLNAKLDTFPDSTTINVSFACANLIWHLIFGNSNVIYLLLCKQWIRETGLIGREWFLAYRWRCMFSLSPLTTSLAVRMRLCGRGPPYMTKHIYTSYLPTRLSSR